MATFDQRQQVVSTQYNAVSDIYLYTQARQVAALPLETIPDPAPLPPGSRMPLPLNPLFVGREADFRALAAALNDISGVSSQMMAVTGLAFQEQRRVNLR